MSTSLPTTSLVSTHLRFRVRVTTPVMIDALSGAALRSSFFNAVWSSFCTNKAATSCAACPLHSLCPVSALVAPLRDEEARGRDIPRPYVIEPPLGGTGLYRPGETFTFGLTLIGTIVQLFPYILLALPRLEAGGLGHPMLENAGRRGSFCVEQVETYHPFTEERQMVYEKGQTRVQAPIVTVPAKARAERAALLNPARVTLRFLTPLRLVDRERLVRRPVFRSLIHRLLERYLALETYYGNQQTPVTLTQEEKETYLEGASRVLCTEDQTNWIEITSHSSRQKRSMPIGGLLGEATFEGPLAPFLDLLVMGELLHVGKNAVKGNGLYRCVLPHHH